MVRRPFGGAPRSPQTTLAASAPPVIAPLPDWFDPSLPPRHDDLAERVTLLPDEADWRPTRRAGLEMRVLEHLGGDAPRLTARLRLAREVRSAPLGDGAGIELLVQRGEIDAADSAWPAGLYARLPAAGEERFESLLLHADDAANEGDADGHGDGTSASLYLATGHIAPGDTEQRRIDTRERERWLPGPVTGTEVMPLHGHGSANVMLIRWLGPVAFRPNLDPLGEEVLVLEGCLHDAFGTYPGGSWIRNPVPAWQSWSGEAGTVVYYKNGHFATVAEDGPSITTKIVPRSA